MKLIYLGGWNSATLFFFFPPPEQKFQRTNWAVVIGPFAEIDVVKEIILHH